MALAAELSAIQQQVTEGSLPLSIHLSPSESRTYDKTEPYLVHLPRLSYLPFIYSRLQAFFAPHLIDPEAPAHECWLSYEGVPLKWQCPIGLLYDLFSGVEPLSQGFDGDRDQGSDGGRGLPWRLEAHFSDWPDSQLVRLDKDGRVMEDSFINCVKEADFIRNGNAKGIMSLSKGDSTDLWKAVQGHDLVTFQTINQKLLKAPGALLRNIPLKIYLPSSHSVGNGDNPSHGSLRVVQSLISPMVSVREPQTVGTALHGLLPSLFPSRRTATLARAVLHGAVLPMSSTLEEVMRSASYLDGWIYLSVIMMG